jgi:hypothetical protein
MKNRPAPLAALLSGCAFASAVSAQQPFATRAQAMDYLAAALPKATAENPKYLTQSDGTLSQWLTDDIRFASAATGPVTVTMRESYTQTKAGKTTPGTHEAVFSLADVVISELTQPGDLTPAGAPARGVLFACAKPGCVAAKWGGQPSRADKTDISIQNDETRARILAAFRRLQAD